MKDIVTQGATKFQVEKFVPLLASRNNNDNNNNDNNDNNIDINIDINISMTNNINDNDISAASGFQDGAADLLC